MQPDETHDAPPEPSVRPLAPVTLGSIVVDPPLFLAPMAGFTNLVFRRIVKRLGCGFTVTEMVLAHGVVRDHERTLSLAELGADERPAGVQIAGGEPELMAEAADRLVDRGVDLIDVNMGCPVRKIVQGCAGASLLRDPARAGAIVEAILRRVDVPVTVKLRAGWDDTSESVATARAVEAAGAAAVAVHGRTREQLYRGRSDLQAIRAVKEAVSIPVIGNGDVVKPEDGPAMVRETGVDGVMIGRAALRDPWIFDGVARAFRGAGPAALPTAAERRAVLVEYFDETAALRGEHRTALQMRRFAASFLKGFPGARGIRKRIPTLDTRADFIAVIDEVFSEGAPEPLVPDHVRAQRT